MAAEEAADRFSIRVLLTAPGEANLTPERLERLVSARIESLGVNIEQTETSRVPSNETLVRWKEPRS